MSPCKRLLTSVLLVVGVVLTAIGTADTSGTFVPHARLDASQVRWASTSFDVLQPHVTSTRIAP